MMILKFSKKIIFLSFFSFSFFLFSFFLSYTDGMMPVVTFLLACVSFVSLFIYICIDYFHLSKLDFNLETFKSSQKCPNPVSFLFKKNNLKSLFEKVYSLLCRQQHYEVMSSKSYLLRDQILENLTDPVIMLDRFDSISFINPSALMLLNQEEALCLGKSIQAFVRNTQFFDLLQSCKSRLCIQKSLILFSSFKSQNFEVTCIPITDDKAKFEGILFLFHDVSLYTLFDEVKLKEYEFKK